MIVDLGNRYGSTYFFEDESFIGITEDDLKPRMFVYPNPTQNSFSIEGIDGMVNIRIFTIDGKLVSMASNIASSELVPIDEIDTGLYFVEIYESSTTQLTSPTMLKLLIE